VREDGGGALKVVVRLARPLQVHAGGATCIDLELPSPVTVGAVVGAITIAHPAVARRVCDETGVLRRHVNIFVGADNVRDLEGLDTVVPEQVEITVLPAVSGG